jgi:hypothetical protein
LKVRENRILKQIRENRIFKQIKDETKMQIFYLRLCRINVQYFRTHKKNKNLYNKTNRNNEKETVNLTKESKMLLDFFVHPLRQEVSFDKQSNSGKKISSRDIQKKI